MTTKARTIEYQPRRRPLIISPRAGQTVELVCIDTRCLGVPTHFLDRTTYPCGGSLPSECPFAHSIHPPKVRYYMCVLTLPRFRPALAEITQHAADTLFQSKGPGEWMRGRRFRLSRGPMRSGPVSGYWIPESSHRLIRLDTLPEPWEWITDLYEMWGRRESLTALELGRQASKEWFAAK